MRDGGELSLDDSQHFPKVPKALSKFLRVSTTHIKLFKTFSFHLGVMEAALKHFEQSTS